MAYGLIHYNQPDLDGLEAFFAFAAEAGFDAVELMPGDVWPQDEANPEGRAEEVRKQAEAAGIAICAFSAGNDFVQLEEAEIEREVRRMERICALARMPELLG